MAAYYQRVLEEARRLSSEERQRLIRELSAPEPQTSGDQVRSLYDALSARGVIGCLKDAPPDLSTNPTFMEGFGQHAP
jgi:hypothetical protein